MSAENVKVDTTEDFIARATKDYNEKLGDKPYIEYLTQVEKNIGAIRESNHPKSDNHPKNTK